jgi:hypothetical protein
VQTHKAKRIGLTYDDSPKDPAEVKRRVQAVLAAYPGLLIDFAHHNEVDRHRAGDIDRWAAETKAIQAALAGLPGVTMTADFTAFNVRNGTSEKFMVALEKIGVVLRLLVFSMYPAGRDDNPATETDMAKHIDALVDFAVKHGVKQVGCWEIGTPLSPNYDRPTLVRKWPLRLVSYCNSKGVVPVCMAYWDSTKTDGTGPDNRFAADGSTTTARGKTQVAFEGSLG